MSVIRNVLANYLGAAWTALMAVAFLPLYIRYLGIEAYGLVGFFITLQAWLLLLDMGLSPTLNREMARFSAGQNSAQGIRDLLRSMEIIYLGVAILVALLASVLGSWIATGWLRPQTLSTAEVSRALAIMGLFFALQWMGTLYRSALSGLQLQVWLSGTSAVVASLRAGGAVLVLAWISPTIAAFLLFQCAVSLLETALLGWYVAHQLPRAPQAARFSLDTLRSVWRFAAGLSAVAFLATLLTQVDRLLLAKLLPLDSYGYFSLAVTVAGGLAVTIGPLHRAAYPRLTELVASGDAQTLTREYHRFAQWLSIVVCPAALVLCMFPAEILLLWTRDLATATAVAPLVSVWVAGSALNGLMHMPYAAQLAHGWTRLSITVNLIAVVVMVPAMLLLVPRHGAIAAAWIWVAINVGYSLFSIAAMHRRILRAEKWAWYFYDVLAPAGAAALIVAFARVAHAIWPADNRLVETAFILAALALATLAAAVATPAGRALLDAVRTRQFKFS
jgi:O-antigen/teichoic acid export membrane protein